MTQPYQAYKKPTRKPNQAHHCLPSRRASSKNNTRFWVYSLLMVAGISIAGLRFSQTHVSTPDASVRNSNPGMAVQAREPAPALAQTEIIPGGLRMQADENGHFRGTLQINGVSMPFMVDTGATNTTLPINLANSAQLPPGRGVETHTAGGTIYGQITVAKSLRLGNAELRNLPVITNPHLDEVLVGMNTLRHFKLTQNGSQLTLVTNSNPDLSAELEENLPYMPAQESPHANKPQPPASTNSRPSQPPTQWKKNTVCDGNQNCRTVYGR